MPTPLLTSSLAALAELDTDFAAWRAVRRRGTPIPAALWSRAGHLAGSLGVHRVASTLRLAPHSLRKHVASAEGTTTSTPAFVEISAASLVAAARSAPPSAGATLQSERSSSELAPTARPSAFALEVSDAGGRRLRVEVNAFPSELLVVARGLWELAR